MITKQTKSQKQNENVINGLVGVAVGWLILSAKTISKIDFVLLFVCLFHLQKHTDVCCLLIDNDDYHHHH